MMKRLCILLLCMATLNGGFLAPCVMSVPPEESQLKAVFVINFAKMTDWPIVSANDAMPFTIAVIGKMPPVPFVNVFKGQTVRGARIVVKHVDRVEQAVGGQILYISASERNNLATIIKDAAQFPLLTISDMNGFCEAGGMIGLLSSQNRLGFEINLTAARRAHLNISSQVLKLAKNIIGN